MSEHTWVRLWWALDLAVVIWLMTRWWIRGQRASKAWKAGHRNEALRLNSREQGWAGPTAGRYLLGVACAFVIGVALAGPVGTAVIEAQFH